MITPNISKVRLFLSNYAIYPLLQSLNLIVDNNHFDSIIYEALINIILRRKEGKVILERYLCAAYLLLVPTTFIKAIKNNNFLL